MGFTLPGNSLKMCKAFKKLSKKKQNEITKKAILSSLKNIDSHFGLHEAAKLIAEYKNIEEEKKNKS